MNDTSKLGHGQARLELDVEGFVRTERLVVYELVNMMVDMMLVIQKTYGLRAEEHQVVSLIALSSVQRFARLANPDPAYMTRIPLLGEYSGSISRRRISEVLGIPLETVRRIVKDLLARDMIVEESRGALTTPFGTLEHFSQTGQSENITRRFIATANSLVRLGAVGTTGQD